MKSQGRKTVFEKANITPDQLEKLIDQYFDSGGNEKTFYVTNSGKTVEKKMKVFSFTGLCLHLGFVSRASFFDWEQKKDDNPFSAILKRARLRIESYYEELIQGGSYVGGIFMLKNLGYSDNATINNISSDGSMSPKPVIISHAKAQDKEVDEIIAKMFSGISDN